MVEQLDDGEPSAFGAETQRSAFVQAVADAVLGPRRHTAEAVAAAVGLTVDDIEPIWMELGFTPSDRSQTLFTDIDVDTLRLLLSARQSQLISDDAAVAMARVLGQTMARVAATQAQGVTAVVQRVLSSTDPTAVEPSLPGPAAGPATIGDGVAVEDLDELAGLVADILVPTMDQFIAYTWRRHLVAAIDRQLQPKVSEVVGFADMVGFTQLSTQMDVDALPDLVGRFQELATQQLVPHDGRLVKTIGDAVLFVFPDGTRAARGALGLVAACAADPILPDVRAGLACGPVAEVDGDVYGDTVNRASRLVALAHPATVLVDEETAMQLVDDDDIVARPLRPHRLKGLGYVRSWVLRRRQP